MPFVSGSGKLTSTLPSGFTCFSKNIHCAVTLGPWRLPDYHPLCAACPVCSLRSLLCRRGGPAACGPLGSGWRLSEFSRWPAWESRKRQMSEYLLPTQVYSPTGRPLLQAACFPGLWLEPRVATAPHVCWTRVAPFWVRACNPTHASEGSPFTEVVFCFLPRH